MSASQGELISGDMIDVEPQSSQSEEMLVRKANTGMAGSPSQTDGKRNRYPRTVHQNDITCCGANLTRSW